MPYIMRALREIVDAPLAKMAECVEPHPDGELNEGLLNYVFTKLAMAAIGPKPSYARINAVVGAFECAKLELYRRLAAPYEDQKAKLNGDVYATEPEFDPRGQKPTVIGPV